MKQRWIRQVMQAGVMSLAMLAGGSQAAMSDPAPTEASWLSAVRAEVKAQRWDQAIAQLRASNATDSAEWHNLLGYALRKRTPPDISAAEGHYQRALELDPKHRQAMEYYGELLLMKNDLPGAEAMLKRLERACFFGCEEQRDLKEAIARFKTTSGAGKK